MARKPKCWSWSTGEYGTTVTAYERTPGGNLYLRVAKPEGGWKRVGLGHKDQQAAKKKAEEMRDRREAGDSPSLRITVGELFKLYTKAEDGKHSATYSGDILRAEELWNRFLGRDFEVRRFTQTQWEAFISLRSSGEIDSHGNRIADPDQREPVGPRVVGKDLKTLRAACRRATIEQTPGGSFLLDADPTRGKRLPEVRNPNRPICTNDRAVALLEVADKVQMRVGFGKQARLERSHLRSLIRIAHDSGRRISSILALQANDWHPDMGTYGKLRWRAEEDKVEREWFAPVSPEVRAELETLLRERPAVGAALLFPSPNNPAQPVSVQVAIDWLRKAEKLAGLPPLRGGAWHPFRRKWATERKHLSAKDVAEVGGWIETTTLQKVYQQPDDETMEQVVLQPRRLRKLG